MSADQAEPRRIGARIVLLAGQAFTLGLTMAWLLVPANTIFLDAYGSGFLPITYIGAALAGAAATAALGRSLRRRPIASVAEQVLVGLVGVLLASWATLWRTETVWVSFALLVLVPIVVPVGFLFLVGQAGALLDVRALKALYGRVIAGFALGLVAGGLATPLLLGALGATEHLLAAAAVASVAFLGLLGATRRRFPSELAAVEEAEAGEERPTLRVVLRDRYVVLLIAFQMLSAIESQWLDYLVSDRAAQRYEGEELARFAGQFTAIAYGADILFLLVLGGLLLRRFGLRYGLAANPGAVLTLLGAIVAAATLQGSGATLVFVLVVGARVVDLTFGDGAGRTAMSAAYQAVPSATRQVAQAAVEGFAVPLAIGISGVGLLVVRATVGTDGLVFPLLIGADVVVWAGVAVAAFRRYRHSLLDGLRHRQLDPAELSVDGIAADVIVRLLDSDDTRDVRLGLDTLELAAEPGLADRLLRFAVDRREAVRVDALERLARVDVAVAAAAARDGLDDDSASVRATCVRVLGLAGDVADAAEVARRVGDPAAVVKVAAAGAVARIGGAEAQADLSAEIGRLARSAEVADRTVAAAMLGACPTHADVDRASLGALVGDPDPDVVGAALDATHWPDDADLVADVIGALHDRRTVGAAVDALVRGGGVVLEAVDEAFDDAQLGPRVHEVLARVCRLHGTAAAAGVLERHVAHSDREVGLAVMVALGALVEPGEATGAPVEVDLEHAARLLHAVVVLDGDPARTTLCVALRDELDLVRARVLAALSTRHGAEAIGRVTFQLAQRDARNRAMAIEWLDVTLAADDRGAIALLEPGLPERDRLRLLARRLPATAPTMNAEELLVDLAEDPAATWRRPWLRACALHAGWGAVDVDIDAVAAGEDDDGILAETLESLRRRAAPIIGTGPSGRSQRRRPSPRPQVGTA